MTYAGNRIWIFMALLGLATSTWAASPPMSQAQRDGWDRVGSVAAQGASATHGQPLPVTAADRHQARKREMVRRMLFLLVAHR